MSAHEKVDFGLALGRWALLKNCSIEMDMPTEKNLAQDIAAFFDHLVDPLGMSPSGNETLARFGEKTAAIDSLESCLYYCMGLGA